MPINRPTLDDLIAVNEEIAALVRAGVPLEPGLAAIARELPGRSGRLAARLADRTAAGATLSEAIAAEGPRLPPLYHAVVAAGLRSGRLDSALAGLVQTARRLAEIRHVTGLALLYPLIVVFVAWLMMGLTIVAVLPRFQGFQSLRIAPSTAAMSASAYLLVGAIIGLGLMSLGLVVLWWRGRWAGAVGAGRGGGRFGRFATLRRVRRLSQAATFADALALLIRHRVPLAEALELAAASTGAAWLEKSATQLAAEVERGLRVTDARDAVDKFPALVRLALLSDRDEAALVAGLATASETYRHRADQDADWLMLRIPVLLTLLLGGGTVAAYAALVLGPYVSILHSLSGT